MMKLLGFAGCWLLAAATSLVWAQVGDQSAPPEAPVLKEVRVAAEKLGFRGVHQIEARFVKGQQLLRVEERWVDVKTGRTKYIVREATTTENNPLAKGLPETALPIRSGMWLTDLGSAGLMRGKEEWQHIFTPRKTLAPYLSIWFSNLSVEWQQNYLRSFRGQQTLPAPGERPEELDLGPLVLTEKMDQTVRLGSAGNEMVFHLTAGIVRSAVQTHGGAVTARWENFLEPEIDLAPPAAIQAEWQKISTIMAKAKPVPPGDVNQMIARSRTYRAFGFRSQYDAQTNGLRIVQVMPGSAAEQQKLQIGDIVKWSDGEDVVRPVGDSRVDPFASKPAFELTVLRGPGPSVKVTVKSATYSADGAAEVKNEGAPRRVGE
jgi:hypothetical protein